MKALNRSTHEIAQILIRSKNELEMGKLLEDILTPAELDDVAERIRIVEALLNGMSQRMVAKQLGVSVSKATRGSQLIQYGTGALAGKLSGR